MQLELWGATSLPRLTWPVRPVGYVLLAIYVLLLLSILVTYRARLQQQTRRQWLLLLGLAIAGMATSQLFPITLSSERQLPPLLTAQNPEAVIAPFGFVAFLLAGAILNPPAAMIVGFASGLGRSLWQSNQVFDPFIVAFTAGLAAVLMEQNYAGRLYELFRKPYVAGPFTALLIPPLVALATLSYVEPTASNLATLDLALSSAWTLTVPLIFQGLMGGAIVALLLLGLPQLRRRPALQPSPFSRSLNLRLLATFLLFALLLSFTLVVVGFTLAVRVSTRIAVQQMAQDAETVSARIPDFRAHRQNLLVQTGRDDNLVSLSEQDSRDVLRRLFRMGDFYRRVALIDETQRVASTFPLEPRSFQLTNLEDTAVENTLRTSAPFISPAQATDDGGYVISFIVPVMGDEGHPEAALMGQVPDVSLDELAVGLQGTLGQGQGFVVDEEGQIIAHPDSSSLLTHWAPPTENRLLSSATGNVTGKAYISLEGSTNARQLVYYMSGPNHPWTVVITVPYAVVLGQGMQIAAQLALVLGAAMLLFGGYLVLLGSSITRPLADLLHASQEIAGGSLNTTIETRGEDEIGHLGQAFRQMQTSLKRRYDQLSLLLDVSKDVSSSMDIGRGMPSIMKGALRGTGAAGVRVVVMNPNARQPLVYGEGPASSLMARYDRQVNSLLRNGDELILATPKEVSDALAPGREPELIPKSLIALPLVTHERRQGIFWVTYRQAHSVDQTELNFLRTLASQASVLVENARLYATAEGGRRRLAAVLASTTDAVIVTDPTEKILLINPAMERLFKLDAGEVAGLPVRSVINSKPLVAALTGDSRRTRSLEVPTEDGKVFYGSASTIFNNDGQAIGRVAVLHDITYLKELDELKSEFVATVSHDLRSPLTFMLGYATMLPMVGQLDNKQQEYVGKIVSGIDKMSGLIDNLLDLGRLEAGVDLVLNDVRVEEVLASVAEDLQQPARASGIDLVVRIPATLPTVLGDVALIRQAVTNLVNNAIKYAPNSGRVILEARLEQDEVVISVIDRGPGIAKDDRVRLFEKFFRAKPLQAKGVKGSGLGLALVKSIAERHGGRAWCESEEGKGSTFFIALPVSR